MFAVRFLRHLRAPVAAVITNRGARTFGFRKCDSCMTWLQSVDKHEILCTFSKSGYQLLTLRQGFQYARKLYKSGFTARNIILCGILGSMSLRPRIAYSVGGFHPMVDYSHIKSPTSYTEGNIGRAMALIMKLVVPLSLLWAMWLNWGLRHPILLVAKVILIFITTKPSSISIYIFVDQFPHQIIEQEPFYCGSNAFQAKTVKVEDYTFFCVARVEIGDQKHIVLGILGGLWILPSSLHKFFHLTSSRVEI